MKNPIIFIHGWGTGSDIWARQRNYFSRFWEVVMPDLIPRRNPRAKTRGMNVHCFLLGSGPQPKDRGAPQGCGSALLQDSRDGQDSLALLDPPKSTSGQGRRVKTIFLEDMADDVRRLLSKRAHIVGWSMGGMVAIKLAQFFPDLVASLILVGSTPKFVNDDNYKGGLSPAIVKRLKARLNNDYRKALYEAFQVMFSNSERLSEEFKKDWRPFMENLPMPSNKALSLFLDGLCEWDLRPVLPSLKVPTLLISGDGDEICPLAASEYMHKNIRDSQLEIFKNAGHIPFLTETRKFNEIVHGFL